MPTALIWHMFLIMLGGGALAAAGSSALFDGPVWVDGVVFLAVSLLLLAMVRPALRRRLTSAAPPETGIEALEGKKALVLDQITQHQGQVKLDGEVWTARPLNGHDVYQPGDQVTVMRIDGATAVVWKDV